MSVGKSGQFIIEIVDRDQEKGVEHKHQLTISTYEGEMHSEPPMQHENNYLELGEPVLLINSVLSRLTI